MRFAMTEMSLNDRSNADIPVTGIWKTVFFGCSFVVCIASVVRAGFLCLYFFSCIFLVMVVTSCNNNGKAGSGILP